MSNSAERTASTRKKCKKCKVPLEGLMYRMIAAKIFGVRPSETDAELCNKCE